MLELAGYDFSVHNYNSSVSVITTDRLKEYELVLNFSISFSIFYLSKQNRHDSSNLTASFFFLITLRVTLIRLMRLAREMGAVISICISMKIHFYKQLSILTFDT